MSVYGFTSSQTFSRYGVPQDYILGPILYGLTLGHIIKQHYILFHCYADDTQLSCKPFEVAKLSSLHNCLAEVKDLMAENSLQLYFSKMETSVSF